MPQETRSSDQESSIDEAARLSIRDADSAKSQITVVLSGSWNIRQAIPSLEQVFSTQGRGGGARRIGFDCKQLSGWDTMLLTFIMKLLEEAERRGVTVAKEGLPEGVQRLMNLAFAAPAKEPPPTPARRSWVTILGEHVLQSITATEELLRFLGEAILAVGRLLTGRASFRRVDLVLTIQECGAKALGIVSLISVLIGLILAFVGAIQLEKFGAQLYVADLVGIAMAREMGAMMTAIIMAGRTGAAFAAQLGTMTVNEEIDALKTMGIAPMEFLVLPRLVALSLMMPLLCLYSDLVGIIGGAIIGVGMLDVSLTQYMIETQQAVTLTHLAVGLTKSVVFGLIVALAGCLRGMQSGRSAAAVGEAATSAVVTAIVWIIVADAAFAVITNILDV